MLQKTLTRILVVASEEPTKTATNRSQYEELHMEYKAIALTS